MTGSEEPMLMDDLVVDKNMESKQNLSPKKSNKLMNRISMFDNKNKPSSGHSMGGGPAVTRAKLRKTYVQQDKSLTASNHASTTPPPKVKTSVQQRLTMFEQRNKETLDLSLHTAHPQHQRLSTTSSSTSSRRGDTLPKRASSVNRYSMRQDNSGRMSGSGRVSDDSEHSSASYRARRSISVGGALRLAEQELRELTRSDEEDEEEIEDFASPHQSEETETATSHAQDNLETSDSNLNNNSGHTGVRAFNRPEAFDSPMSGGGKRSWRPKGSITSLDVSSAPPLDNASGHHEGGGDSDEAEEAPKRSWKVKPKTSQEELLSDDDNHAEEMQVPLKDADEDAPPMRSWKAKREISAGEKTEKRSSGSLEGSNHSINRSSTHSNNSASGGKRSWRPKGEKRTSIADLEPKPASAPNSPHNNSLNGSTHGRRSVGKLKDRINMFNSGATTAAQPAFLSKKHMKKKKEPANGESEKSTDAKKEEKKQSKSKSKSSGKTKKASNEVETSANVAESAETATKTEQPKISLDRKRVQDDKNKKKAKYRTKSFVTRGMLKSSKSALVGQKNKDKNAVFANVLSQKEDLSSLKMKDIVKDAADTKIIMNALRKNFVFEEMEDQDMEKLVGAMAQVKVDQGKEIITQGEMGDYFYVIGRGEVSFVVDGKKVGSSKEGNSFGELALLYNCPRAASVVADSQPTTLFRVDQKVFRFMMQSQTKKSEEEKKKLIQNVPFLSDLASEDVSRLCSVMKPVLFSTGDYIVQKGECGTSLFIMREGRVRVTDIFVGGTSYEDVFLGVGDYFGEDALISDEPRAANVVALTKGSAFSVDRESIQKVLGDFASLISKAQDKQKLVRLHTHPLFRMSMTYF